MEKSQSEKSRDTTRETREAKAIEALVDVLAEKLQDIHTITNQLAGVDDVLRETSEYLVENFARIDETLLLILRKLNGNENLTRSQREDIKRSTKELEIQTIKSAIRSLRTQILQHQENINQLEEKAAIEGIDFTITNQIITQQTFMDKKKQKIIELERDLK